MDNSQDIIVGREREQALIREYCDSPKAELVAIYGRRRVEKTLQHDSFQEGKAAGLAEGLAEGERKGRAEGELSKSLAIAKNMLASGMSEMQVMQFTGLTQEQIAPLLH